MATGTVQLAPVAAPPTDRFYERYRWCLNPMLSLRDLLRRMGEELDYYRDEGPSGWQGAERRINLWLFACAIACTLDDYLSSQPRSLAALSRRLPAVRTAIRAANCLPSPTEARVREWRNQWTDCVNAACDMLLETDSAGFAGRARQLLASASKALDERALSQRMRIPEAFRCQDLAHQDVGAMVRLCLPALPKTERPIAIMGPRTAGAYFAPLAAAHLRALGYQRVTWLTTRPKNGLPRGESRAVKAAVRAGAQWLMVDDHPNSGNTLRLLLNELRNLGAASKDIVAALPGHPSIPNFAAAEEAARGVRIFLMPPAQRHKARLLESAWPEQVLGERLTESPATARLNRHLAAHYPDGFQVRLKRVFDTPAGRVIAKSTGWGWLGYHAWLAAQALQGFVPEPICLREGMLFSAYVESDGETCVTNRQAEACASYIARRVRNLALPEDPAFATPGYRWCGWDDLVAVLSRIYGARLGPFKRSAIRQRLRNYVAPNPTLVDGRMQPADWLDSGQRLFKADFEHHNFGGGEPDIVDPAWDLASAIFEFQMPSAAERVLLDKYVAETGDAAVEERLLLYKILYAMNARRAAQYWLARKPDADRRDDWNRQFIAARSFAAFHVARYLGRQLGPAPGAWERRLFFLDLDGVLDWGLLGFPHTTRGGVHALQLLRRNRFAVVLNTARSLEHVREYCRAYGLPGGVAELGSVFWDAIRDWEVPLIDGEAAAQIEGLREQVRSLPGVFVDPENRYSIRAYRFACDYMRPLETAEAEALLERAGCHRLTIVQSQADTYIVAKGAGKGPAIASVKAYLGRASDPVAAIGDSAQDVSMLRAAEMAFAPANASREVRELVARGECRRMGLPLQAGLLEAAMSLCLAAGHNPGDTAAARHAAYGPFG